MIKSNFMDLGEFSFHLSLKYFVGHVETHLSLTYFVGHVETHLSWLTTTKYNKYNTFTIVGGVNLVDLNELLAHLSQLATAKYNTFEFT